MFKNQLSEEQLLKRVKSRSGEDVRSPYYRDTTAIIHSLPFRRLKHKTQVFFAPFWYKYGHYLEQRTPESYASAF